MNPVNESGSLTYEPFYGLREKAFSLSADPRFLFRSPAHGPAFDEIHTGIRRREGLIVLTGEIGTGKTTLCRSVLQQLDRRTFSAFIADPFVSREDLLKTLLVDFGVTSMSELARGRFNGASRSDLSYPLYEFLDSLVPLQAFAVVVIDEAQNLSLPLLEEIRILSDLERRERLLQFVLVGQPELRLKLKLAPLRQLEQRVSVRCELGSLDAAGVTGYVRHRLAVAGAGESRVEFTPSALLAIQVASAGVPRLINRICDRALQHAFASQAMKVDADCVRAVIDDGGLRRRPADDAPPERPTGIQPIQVTSLEPALSALAQFAAEPSAPAEEETPNRRPGPSGRWVKTAAATAAAAALVIAASIGAPAYFAEEPLVDRHELAAMIPAAPGHAFLPRGLPRPVIPESPAPTAAPADAPAVRSAAVTEYTSYSILVASFQTADRAERVVDELVNAGFSAHTVERSGGPTGRIMQVEISGYTSAPQVQRALQRIRELPGGFADARIVGQN